MDVTLLTNGHRHDEDAAPEPAPSPTAGSPLGHHRATVFDSDVVPADAAALAQLEDGVLDADLAAAPVVLPDFHHKHNMEMPSSIAVATTGTIRPTLTSSSVNCGMALLAFDVERPARPAVTEFFDRVRARYPYPTTHRRDLDTADVLRCAAEGGRFAVDRWGIDPDELCRVEEDACLPIDPFGGLVGCAGNCPLGPPALPAALRHRRPHQPLRRAPAGRGGLRSGHRGHPRRGRGAGHPPVPRRRRRARR